MATHACSCGLIDVHAHCLPSFYKEALAAADLVTIDGGFPIPEWSPERALEMMDAGGVDAAILSTSSPSVHFLAERRERAAMARRLNESLAETAAAHPGRFGSFATLPFPHIDDSLKELRHALGVLQLQGVVVETNTDGRYLSDEALAPVFAAIAERAVPVFLHPTSPACFEAVRLGRPAPLFEFPVETGRTVVDMIFAGVFDRWPDLKLILPHAGGVPPSIARRIALLSSTEQMKPSPKDGAEVMTILRRLYYDLAMAADQETFGGLRTLAPLAQIVFGTDFPFQSPDKALSNVESFRNLTGLTAEEHERIARGTALDLFRSFMPAVMDNSREAP